MPVTGGTPQVSQTGGWDDDDDDDMGFHARTPLRFSFRWRSPTLSLPIIPPPSGMSIRCSSRCWGSPPLPHDHLFRLPPSPRVLSHYRATLACLPACLPYLPACREAPLQRKKAEEREEQSEEAPGPARVNLVAPATPGGPPPLRSFAPIAGKRRRRLHESLWKGGGNP